MPRPVKRNARAPGAAQDSASPSTVAEPPQGDVSPSSLSANIWVFVTRRTPQAAAAAVTLRAIGKRLARAVDAAELRAALLDVAACARAIDETRCALPMLSDWQALADMAWPCRYRFMREGMTHDAASAREDEELLGHVRLLLALCSKRMGQGFLAEIERQYATPIEDLDALAVRDHVDALTWLCECLATEKEGVDREVRDLESQVAPTKEMGDASAEGSQALGGPPVMSWTELARRAGAIGLESSSGCVWDRKNLRAAVKRGGPRTDFGRLKPYQRAGGVARTEAEKLLALLEERADAAKRAASAAISAGKRAAG